MLCTWLPRSPNLSACDYLEICLWDTMHVLWHYYHEPQKFKTIWESKLQRICMERFGVSTRCHLCEQRKQHTENVFVPLNTFEILFYFINYNIHYSKSLNLKTKNTGIWQIILNNPACNIMWHARYLLCKSDTVEIRTWSLAQSICWPAPSCNTDSGTRARKLAETIMFF